MTTPRRRIVRPPTVPPSSQDAHRQRRIEKLRVKLEKERTTLARWMARLRRIFHGVENLQRKTARIEKQIVKLEAGS